jgi:hypothetical protein
MRNHPAVRGLRDTDRWRDDALPIDHRYQGRRKCREGIPAVAATDRGRLTIMSRLSEALARSTPPSLRQAHSPLGTISPGTVHLPVSLLILAGSTSAGIIRQGAFYPVDAFTVAAISLGLIVTSLVIGTDRGAVLVALGTGASTLWWLFSAMHHGHSDTFLPLGASLMGFLAAFLVVRRLGIPDRQVAAQILAATGAFAAAVGLAASVMRWYPLSMPAQDLWRLSTSLTYSDAAGMLLGITLLIGIALDQRRWISRFDVSLCMAGLVATQSRGAVLGVLVGAFFVPVAAYRAALRPLGAGLAGGLVVVGTSSGSTKHVYAAVALALIILIIGVVRLPLHTPALSRRHNLAMACAAVVAAGVTVAALHTPIQRRVDLGSTSDRITEWHAAFDQWRSSPWIGVGPDVLLHFHAVDGTFAHFAHNEYLQVAADSGLVGEILLLMTAGTVIAAVRREDTLSSCATAALVTFAVAGALDFDWHLAALGLVGGWVAGLSGRPPDATARRKDGRNA